MPRFKVKITTTVTTSEEVEVECDSTEEFRVREAVERLYPSSGMSPNAFATEEQKRAVLHRLGATNPAVQQHVDVLKQLDGPWVEPGYGGELWYINKSPIMTFRASFGNYLTPDDIELLIERVTAEGLESTRNWRNSEGGVSIEFKERKFDPMPAEMTARILAPKS